MTLEALNALPGAEAKDALERCCGSRAWVERVAAARPFASREALLEAGRDAFSGLSRRDWLESFAHHPRIGDLRALRERFAATAAWAGDEQRGASAADDATLQALAEGNAAYERRFGYIFIVCATGKSVAEMLGLLRARLGNDSEAEMRIAADEQKKITALRLEKLIEG